ncbi:MAG: hypothetical protein WCG06_05190, partial [Candidatus Omnitrophota bacterium]
YKAGVRFFSESIYYFWQIIDTELMKTRLLESIYYLQSQPPLFNIFLGIVYKIFPGHGAMTLCFHAIYTVMGLTMTLILCRTLRLARIPRVWALMLTVLFMISPSCLAYENFLMYTYPLALFFTLAAYYLIRHAETGGFLTGLGFFACLTVIILIRGTYHLLYFIAVFWAVRLCLKPQWRRRFFWCAVGPFLLIAMVYVKNFALFGTLTSSGSWSGVVLAMGTTYQLPIETRQDLMDRKLLTPFAGINPLFSKPAQFRRYLPAQVKTGIPVLDQEYKSSGYPNMNNPLYLKASEQCLRDGFFTLSHYPGVFWNTWRQSFILYLIPGPSKFGGEGLSIENMQRIGSFESVYNRWIIGEAYLPGFNLAGKNRKVGFNLPFVVGLPLILIVVPVLLYQQRRQRPQDFKPELVLTVFCWVSIGYTTIICTALGSLWNNRYRFNVEGLQLILTALVVHWIILTLLQMDKKFQKS